MPKKIQSKRAPVLIDASLKPYVAAVTTARKAFNLLKDLVPDQDPAKQAAQEALTNAQSALESQKLLLAAPTTAVQPGSSVNVSLGDDQTMVDAELLHRDSSPLTPVSSRATTPQNKMAPLPEAPFMGHAANTTLQRPTGLGDTLVRIHDKLDQRIRDSEIDPRLRQPGSNLSHTETLTPRAAPPALTFPTAAAPPIWSFPAAPPGFPAAPPAPLPGFPTAVAPATLSFPAAPPAPSPFLSVMLEERKQAAEEHAKIYPVSREDLIKCQQARADYYATDDERKR